jgi:hypothetical protein
MRVLPIFVEHRHLMGLIIGREGAVFKNITQESGAVYIFYRQDLGLVEIWGNPESIDGAIKMLCDHINFILNKHFYVPGFDHLPPFLRPTKFFRSVAIV